MADPLADAAPGPAIRAELVSLSGLGQLYAAYDWPHETFNNTEGPGSIHGNAIAWSSWTAACGSAPGFAWTITKIGDGEVELTPDPPVDGV
ncbi:MAG TPA: hypothetical protein VF577_06735, partial [Allosphingosinicella sp.]